MFSADIQKKRRNICIEMAEIKQIFAGMAQLVEQRIRNAQVIGSSPITSSKKFRSRRWAEFFTYSLLTFHSSLEAFLWTEYQVRSKS